MLIIFLSLGTAITAVVLAFVATAFIGSILRLGDVAMLLSVVVPPCVGIWMFIFTLKRLRSYMSN